MAGIKGWVLAIACLTGAPVFAQPPPAVALNEEHEAAIRRLLEVMGVAGGGGKVIDEMFSAARKNFPAVPPAVWDELRKEYASDDFLIFQVDIYKKHFSREDAQELTAFFESPVGRKFIEAQPELVKEGLAVGQEFSRRVLQRLRRQLQERGYRAA